MSYRAVIFDFDYTLGDATEAIYAGFCHAFTARSLPVPELAAVRATIGLPVRDGYTAITGDATEAGRDAFYDLFHPFSREMQARGIVNLFPGAEELLTTLASRGIPAAIVSSKNQDTVEELLLAKGIRPYFVFLVGGGTVPTYKPDPQGLNLAIDTLRVPKSDVLYCGDTVIDAQTAQNAEVDFCAVLNGTTPAEEFTCYPHVHIADDLPDLQAWLVKEGLI